MTIDVPGLHGAHLRSDLIELFGRRRLAAALANGEVRPLWTRVVVEATRFLDVWTRAGAAQLSTGPTSVLCGSTAAVLHGCQAIDSPATHVRMPYGHKVSSRGGLIVHNGGFFADDIELLDGLRVLALDRVVADLLCVCRSADALAVADEVLRGARPDHEVFRKRVGERLSRRQDPRGTVRGGHILDLASPRAESPPESWLRMALAERGFPLPEVNWPIVAPDGSELYRIDLAWPGLRIALEYDGYAVHLGRTAEDDVRAEDLRRRGWIVIRADRNDLSSLWRVENELRAAFARRGYTW